jgi:transposase-like protein
MNANGHRPASREPDALRAEIARTRVELGETVSALAAKVDVKARAQEYRSQLGERVRQTAGEMRGRAGQLAHRAEAAPGSRLPMLGAVAALTLILIGLATRRRRGGR